MKTDSTAQEGLRRTAVLMLSLDEDTAADVMKFFSSDDMSKLSSEMARLGNITHEEIRKALEQFMGDAELHASVNVETNDYIRAVLVKALGEEKASQMLDDIIEEQQSVFGIDKLNLMEANSVAEMIRDEHPQIIATILVHLERGQAAAICELFDQALRNDVLLRIANFSGVQPIALQELKEVLGNMLDGQNLKRSKMGGVRATAEILNTMQSAHEESAMQAIREFSADLATRIEDEMFLFENLLDLDDASINVILNQVDQNTLVIALKGAAPDLQQKFTSQMSVRAAEMFKEDMESRGPIRMSQVEAEQKVILEAVRRLAATGEIVIGSGDDSYV